ncbi:MAG: hypothetical protein L3J41_13475 [Melioribacteraceae bacterium]|nr:hypothetical protein [Melioribacteraceae bacterium]
MDFEKRSNENKKGLPSKRSIRTVIEISKKINELLEQMEYDNNELLLTKEHIKHNLIQLINYADYQSIIKTKKVKKNRETRSLELYSHFSHNYYIDNRGRLITNYSK